MLRFSVVSAGVFGVCSGHSWAEIVGGGSYRGAQGADDLIKQRYYCPLPSLADCQPPASTNVVLNESNQRPCRSDFPTPVWGSAFVGEQMYVHWAGNGHTGSSNGTCVSMYLAPYAIDPDFSSFRKLVDCLPFSYGADITDGNVTIPSDITPGNYTLFWLWDFSFFWFSSCTDIHIYQPGTTTRTPSIASTTPGSMSSEYRARGCQPLDSGFCAREFGPKSYCKTWSLDRCGRAQCFDGDIASLPCSTLTLTTRPPVTSTMIRTTFANGSSSTTRPPVLSTNTTIAPSSSSLSAVYRTTGCGKLPSNTCPDLFGAGSYCKTWAFDGCGRSVCFGARGLTQLGSCRAP